MQDVWQLVRILTVFILCLPSPVAGCYLCLGGISLASTDPPMWALKPHLRLRQRGTPKLLVLITQKDSLPDSGMWSPLGSQQGMSEDESLPLSPAPNVLCTRQLRWWVSAFVLHRTTHTHTLAYKHSKPPHTRLNTLPNAHRHTQLAAVTQTPSPQCAVKTFFKNTQKLCVRYDEKCLKLYHADFRWWLQWPHQTAALLTDVSLSILLCMDRVKDTELGSCICAIITGEKRIYIKKSRHIAEI